MYTGMLPAASIYGTWSENLEVWDVDTDALMDLSDVDEITLILQDQTTRINEITLTMSGGDITIPSTGIIQWRAELDAMGTLAAKTYKVIMTLEGGDDTVPIVLGLISVVD